MIRILYFASLRDRLGQESEELELPAHVADVGALRTLLQSRGGIWSELFGGDTPVLAAVNQEMAQEETPVAEGDEIGFFPPVTGG